ncbi:MAG: hypothetical protein M3Y26_04575 [Actinomycetota bacterium]|nr:hypothetical protein [Actinomycetota bacterium]
MTTTAAANIAAEVRGIESGRNCRWSASDHCFIVHSEGSDRTYELSVSAADDLLVISCTCPAGTKGAQRPRPAGVQGCKHRAILARRLERAGHAHFGTDGRWHVSTDLLTAAVA